MAHTVQDFIRDGRESWIRTHAGIFQVSHIRWPKTNPWAVTPDSNGGAGSSWCVHYGTTLYSSYEEAEAETTLTSFQLEDYQK